MSIGVSYCSFLSISCYDLLRMFPTQLINRITLHHRLLKHIQILMIQSSNLLILLPFLHLWLVTLVILLTFIIHPFLIRTLNKHFESLLLLSLLCLLLRFHFVQVKLIDNIYNLEVVLFYLLSFFTVASWIAYLNYKQ